MIVTGIIIVLFAAAVFLFLSGAAFGQAASGQQKEALGRSPQFKDGQFRNLNHTPQLTGDASLLKVMKAFFFGKSKRSTPSSALPSKKTDLYGLRPDEDVLVWFGHSSYFLQLNGKRLLIDPVFSGHASPVRFLTRSFKGSDVYTAADIPPIDVLLITHDHYDHLDHKTMVALRPKIGTVVTGLGAGGHLMRWGYDPGRIIEKDWNEELVLGEHLRINTTPARHFAGRTFKRNTSLWLSFVLRSGGKTIFIGGDSGYDTHFKTIGAQFGPFDLVVLENGQYNQYWKFIHMMPEETVQAAIDLKAKKLLPVHWAKFSLSLHAWDEPIERLVREARNRKVDVLHPMIGEAVFLDREQSFSEWWTLHPA